ncbi:metalloreductase [Aspergillus uvarum CBS 121591]|uniref:Metalloreductase n=1 Tax=Aspergillus uvarum CBS 121591 TaxID=1448315 RepID=A0A319D060_9EURO|nr:metalloreductase [Aspergillus uvarum CBS 121591]PYH84413.1 metalloreductase [Aspergillus uvarum CBS 121591]
MQMQGMSGGSYHGTLSASDFNLTNETQKAIFLHDLKHLAAAPLEGSQAAEHFWYGIIALLVLYTAFSTGLATSTALVREASYLQWSPRWLQIPPMGSLWLIAAYFSFLLGLEFNNNHAPGAMYWQLLGTRAGWLATAQIPLLVALAGKYNLIGLFCGVSNYTRLNIYHRWVARGLLLLSTLHFACQNHGWDVYDVSRLEWMTDSCPITGIAAYAFVLWMNLTTLAPFRSLCYELFVIQHLITFFGFVIAISYHLQTGTEPSTQRYIYVSAAIWIVTMLVRFCWVGYTNAARPGHARLEAMAGGATRVCITSHPLRRWSPGSHILLSLPRLAWPLSTHPATILSTPTSHHGDLILILKARRGFTDRLLRTASRTAVELSSSQPEEPLADEHAAVNRHPSAYLAWIDGPYPSTIPDLSSFDSVLLIAGGTGVTFTLSQLLHLAHLPRQEASLLRHVTFIWVVREGQCLSWIQQELQELLLQQQQQQQGGAFHLHVKLFITRDTTSTEWAEEEKEEKEKEKEAKEKEEDTAIETTNDNPQAGCDFYGSEKPAAGPAAAADQLSLNMPGVSVQTGRPTFDAYIEAAVLQANGEVAVACCGPIALTVAVRQSVVRVSDGLGVSKGSGLPGVMLHVENSA